MKYTIEYKFTSLNEYVNAERTNKYIGAKIKKRETEIARLHFIGKPKIQTPCKLRFHWGVTSKRMDLDNRGFSRKFLLDGMVQAGIIPNDNLNHVIELRDTFEISKIPFVEITVIEEVNNVN